MLSHDSVLGRITRLILDFAMVLSLLAMLIQLITTVSPLAWVIKGINSANLRMFAVILAVAVSLRLFLALAFRDEWADRFQKITQHKFFPWLLFLVMGIFFLIANIHHFFAFIPSDYSEYFYIQYNTLHGDFLFSPFLDKCFLAEHFSPILLTVTPFFALFPSVYTLMMWHSLSLALTVVPTFYLAKAAWHDGIVATLFSLAMVTMLPMASLMASDVHHEVAFLPLLFWAALMLERKRPWLFLLALLLLFTVKEDAAVYVFLFGVAAMIYRRWWLPGIATVISSIALWYLIIYLAMPAFGAGKFGASSFLAMRWSGYGSTHEQVALWFLTHPLNVLGILLQQPFFRYVGSFLAIPLLSPWFLASIPLFLLNLSSAEPLQRDLLVYFGGGIASLLGVAFIYGLANLKRWFSAFPRTSKWIIPIAVCLFFTVNFGYIKVFKPDDGLKEAESMLANVPTDASFAGQEHVVVHITPRQNIYTLPHIQKAEYIFIDNANKVLYTGEYPTNILNSLLRSPRYEMVASRGETMSGDVRFFLFRQR